MKEEMKHKENGIAQLKSQLEYQCLGKMLKVYIGIG